MEPQLREYINFLVWFHNYYPELHKKYWTNIDIPRKDEGISVNYNGINAQTHNMVVQLAWEYYRHKDME